jgi:hypothetical protein
VFLICNTSSTARTNLWARSATIDLLPGVEIPMNRLAVDCLDEMVTSEWEERVNISLDNLRYRASTRSIIAHELFSHDGCRYTIKAAKYTIFEIFPWFIRPRERSRYRETLAIKKGEKIEDVIEAIQFFHRVVLEEADYLSLKDHFLATGPPQRLLWSIVDLKIHFEDQRFLRYTTGLKSSPPCPPLLSLHSSLRSDRDPDG